MKKILILITTAFAQYGGLTTVVMNYYRHMNRDGLQIDFASTNLPDERDAAYETLLAHGSRYFCMGSRKKNPLRYLSKLRKLLKKERYDVIHVNGNSSTMALELLTGRLAGVPRRVAHGHTTRSEHPLAHTLLSGLFRLCYTDAVAASVPVGEWLFGDGYLVLNNAIEPARYSYDPEKREEWRARLNLTDSFVVGNVGKFYAAKNQSFLIDVFAEIKKRVPDAKLVFVGGGELEEPLKAKCRQLRLEEDTLFLGMRKDIPSLMQTFDYFVFPSLYEGFGLALLEAQCSGLRCAASDAVPRSADATGNVIYMSLADTPAQWAEIIADTRAYDREQQTEDARQSIREHGLDIRTEAVKLEKLYRGDSAGSGQ